MADVRENNQKIKLLKLMEMLRQDTDEQNPLTTEEICTRLAEMNISCDSRTVGRDMKFLNAHGYEVMDTSVGREKAYYVADRSFSVPELKILMDAVQASGFITSKKTAEMTEKIAALGGSHMAEILSDNIIQFTTRKHTNENIFYNIEALESAILSGKQVSFLYFDLDEKKNRIYRKDKSRYIVDPIGLVYMEDNYYLTSFTKEHGITNFRVDRMESVVCEDSDISAQCREAVSAEDIAKRTDQSFRMYGGRSVNVKLRFDRKLIGAVYDKFGEETKISRIDDTYCTAMVKVQESPTFFSWISQFKNMMQVLSPASVKDNYIKHLEETLSFARETEERK